MKAIATPPNEKTLYKKLTLEQEETREIEEKEFLEKKPLNDWLQEVSAYDNIMSRALEDVIDVLNNTTRGKINQNTLDKYNFKKEIRSRKPEVF